MNRAVRKLICEQADLCSNAQTVTEDVSRSVHAHAGHSEMRSPVPVSIYCGTFCPCTSWPGVCTYRVTEPMREEQEDSPVDGNVLGIGAPIASDMEGLRIEVIESSTPRVRALPTLAAVVPVGIQDLSHHWGVSIFMRPVIARLMICHRSALQDPETKFQQAQT